MMKWILSFSNLFLFLSFLNAQCVSGDCQNGKGTYVYPSGAKYVGEFQNGEIHGVGVCYYTDGSKFSGQWAHRFPEGKGTKTFADGSKRTGDWIKGQPVDDEGNFIEEEMVAKGENNEDSNIQTGCISGDCEDGNGVFAYADGSKFDGDFKNGELNGQGTWYFPNGDKYVGTFKDNYSHGQGVLFNADGTKMTGQWIEGEYKGDVELIAKEGEGCILGDCRNGIGTYVYEGAEAKYIGAFKNNMADGQGTCYYSNGERYEGQWSNGSFNGTGTLFLSDGTEVNGVWDFGTFMGKNGEVAKKEEKIQKANIDAIEDVAEQITRKEAMDMKVWAVVIGVASYSHMPVLRYTDDDAYRMFAFLKSPEGGALSDEHIRILIDEEATKENITNTMKDVFSKAGPSDLVMLYFSGHGLKGSFLPIDFDGYNNKIYHEEINEILENSPAKYKLCIADACHSGSLFAMKGNVENALNNYYKSLAQAQAGTALIMSSKSDETSLESSGLRQGVFSHFLIRGLKGEADVNGNQIVSVQELYDFIGENVRTYTGMRQSPVIKGDYDTKMTVAVIR